VSPECRAVKQCVYDSGCYLPVPAYCFCGDAIDNCEDPLAVANGPCRDEIVAGSGGGTLDNATVLIDRFYNDSYPTGWAMLIMDEASRLCANECFPAE
jgi:hypothetical protein